MQSICKKYYFAGNVCESLTKQGWIGCRKVLEIIQTSLNHPDPRIEGKSTEEISAVVHSMISCEEAATGWVDNGPFGSRSGRSFNGVLMTRGTTACCHFKNKQKT